MAARRYVLKAEHMADMRVYLHSIIDRACDKAESMRFMAPSEIVSWPSPEGKYTCRGLTGRHGLAILWQEPIAEPLPECAAIASTGPMVDMIQLLEETEYDAF